MQTIGNKCMIVTATVAPVGPLCWDTPRLEPFTVCGAGAGPARGRCRCINRWPHVGSIQIEPTRPIDATDAPQLMRRTR